MCHWAVGVHQLVDVVDQNQQPDLLTSFTCLKSTVQHYCSAALLV